MNAERVEDPTSDALEQISSPVGTWNAKQIAAAALAAVRVEETP